MDEKEEFFDRLEAVKFTSSENLISMFVIVTTLFFHLVFTMAFHVISIFE